MVTIRLRRDVGTAASAMCASEALATAGTNTVSREDIAGEWEIAVLRSLAGVSDGDEIAGGAVGFEGCDHHQTPLAAITTTEIQAPRRNMPVFVMGRSIA